MRFLFGDCILDPTRRELLRGGEAIHVEPRVFDLLLHLIRNREQVVSKDDILAAVWGGRIVSESTLNNRINAARHVIGDSGERQHFIRTIARRGLRFVGHVRQEPIDSKRNEENFVPAPAPTKSGPPYGVEGVRQTSLGERCELGGKPTLVVLPFNNMSGDPEQEYFSGGITEDIITVLSKHRSLLVIARNSAFAFKGHGSDVRRIGTELRADYIVEGSVRKIGQGVRITVHLIETEGGPLVWAEQYDRDLEEIFELQDEITRTIAARIEPGVGTAERLRAERKPPEALQAWNLFHLGTKHLYKFAAEDNRGAQRLLRRARALDPKVAQAHAFLSHAIVLSMLYFDANADDKSLNEAECLAKKGVEFDDQDALIRFIHGRVLLARGGIRGRARRAGAQPQLARRLLRSWRYARLRRPLRRSHSLFREGHQPQPPRSAARGVLLLRGACATLCSGIRQSIRVGAEGNSASELSLLALCAPVGCPWIHGAENCRHRASATKAGILVRLRASGSFTSRTLSSWTAMLRAFARQAYLSELNGRGSILKVGCWHSSTIGSRRHVGFAPAADVLPAVLLTHQRR